MIGGAVVRLVLVGVCARYAIIGRRWAGVALTVLAGVPALLVLFFVPIVVLRPEVPGRGIGISLLSAAAVVYTAMAIGFWQGFGGSTESER